MPEVYLYGVAAADRCWRPEGFEGVHGAAVRLVEHRSLAAFVSDVAQEVPGRRRELLAHTSVLEQALEASTILPAQFGTVAPGDQAVIDDLLTPRHDELTELLEQVEGLVEVRISGTYDEEAVLAEVLRRRPELRAQRPRQDRMELGRRVVAAIDEQRRTDAAVLLQALAPRAREIREQPPRGELGVLDLAVLLHRDDLAAFDEAVSAGAAPLADRMKIRYVGPMPPASFVSLDAA